MLAPTMVGYCEHAKRRAYTQSYPTERSALTAKNGKTEGRAKPSAKTEKKAKKTQATRATTKTPRRSSREYLRTGDESPEYTNAPPNNATPNAAALPDTEEALPPPRPRVKDLDAILRKYAGKALLVLLTGAPDPDSISSAWALKYIARAYDVETTILYTTKLSHQENRAMVKSMEIPMVFYSERFDFTPYVGLCIVDAPSPIIAPTLAEAVDQLPLVALVDHHKSDGDVTAEFSDVREGVGSTATIFAEYLREGHVGLEYGRQEDIQLATALMHGIRSDTDYYFAARGIDFLASSYLAPFADSELLQIVSTQLIPPKTMDILQRALETKIIRENYLMAGVGYARAEDRDAIPQAADYLVRREGIDTVIVFGIIDEKFIEGSLRTRSRLLDPDPFLKQILGLDSDGKPYGGGRLDKGGFKIPVGMFSGCSDKQLLWEMTTKTLTDIFFKALGIAKGE